MKALRVALVGSGSPASVVALTALAGHVTVAAVVLPGSRPGFGPRALHRRWLRRRAVAPLVVEAARRGVPCVSYRPGRPAGLADALRRHRVELLCVATFPYLLPAEVLQAAPEGAAGIHSSLLPRHRGPDPLFWTYHADDAAAGVSLIRLDGGADTGALLGQECVPLERGRLGSDLYLDCARRGAAMLAGAVTEWESWRARGRPQAEDGASGAPVPRAGTWRIDFDAWSAERVWHFLRGVGERGGILRGEDGRALPHGPARSFALGPRSSRPGAIDVGPAGLTVHCRDGHVAVAHRRRER